MWINFYFISEFFILQIFKNPVDFILGIYSYKWREYKIKIISKIDQMPRDKQTI